MHAFIHACIHACMHSCKCVHIYMCLYTHVHTHTIWVPSSTETTRVFAVHTDRHKHWTFLVALVYNAILGFFCSQVTVWQHHSRSIYPKWGLIDWLHGQERAQEPDSQHGFEGEVSEAEDRTKYNPDQQMNNEEESSDEKDGLAEAAVTFKSKNGNLSSPENQVRLSAENVIRTYKICCILDCWHQIQP